jgi:hypothetical protein
VAVTVNISEEAARGLDDYLKFKDVTKSAIIEKLIRTQLLRKRQLL